jgi:hypothetical protein
MACTGGSLCYFHPQSTDSGAGAAGAGAPSLSPRLTPSTSLASLLPSSVVLDGETLTAENLLRYVLSRRAVYPYPSILLFLRCKRSRWRAGRGRGGCQALVARSSRSRCRWFFCLFEFFSLVPTAGSRPSPFPLCRRVGVFPLHCRVKVDDVSSPGYVTCVLSDTAWRRVELGRDVITRAIESGKVSPSDPLPSPAPPLPLLALHVVVHKLPMLTTWTVGWPMSSCVGDPGTCALGGVWREHRLRQFPEREPPCGQAGGAAGEPHPLSRLRCASQVGVKWVVGSGWCWVRDRRKRFSQFLCNCPLILSGIGKPLSLDRTRRLLALRINVLAKGFSGVRPETVEKMLAFLNSNCLSLVPEQGSVGASGDLAPLCTFQ